MKEIFVYGTLRKGEGNYQAFSRKYEMEVLKEGVPATGYKMYEVGIPFVCYTGNPDDVIYGDILAVDDNCCESIDAMEEGAGYDIGEIIPDGSSRSYRAYLYDFERIPQYASFVETGNFKEVS